MSDADRKKPVTFQSLELQTFDQALERLNLITQEIGLGYWTMVRDGYLEFHQLSEWYRRMPAERLYDSEAAYAKAKAAIGAAKLSGTDLLDVQRLMDDAEHNIRLVKLGHGVHNVNYSTALLNVAAENCGKVVQSVTQRQAK